MTEDGGRKAQAFRSSMSPCLVVRFRNQRPKSRPHLREFAAFASLSSYRTSGDGRRRTDESDLFSVLCPLSSAKGL